MNCGGGDADPYFDIQSMSLSQSRDDSMAYSLPVDSIDAIQYDQYKIVLYADSVTYHAYKLRKAN